jgi:hypothetical protein
MARRKMRNARPTVPKRIYAEGAAPRRGARPPRQPPNNTAEAGGQSFSEQPLASLPAIRPRARFSPDHTRVSKYRYCPAPVTGTLSTHRIKGPSATIRRWRIARSGTRDLIRMPRTEPRAFSAANAFPSYDKCQGEHQDTVEE